MYNHEDDVRALRESVEKFCRHHLGAEVVSRRDQEHRPPYDLLKKMGEMGLIRAAFPESVGGIALGWKALAQIHQIIGSHWGAASSILDRSVSFGGMPLLKFGSAWQQEHILQPLLDGDVMIALALTEPGAGSDSRASTTRATRDGDAWTIHGRKTWISDAGEADYLLTLCRTSAPNEPATFTTFLVPRDADGVHMTPLPKVGNNGMPSFDIGMDSVVVHDRFRLGEVGKGLRTVFSTLTYSRTGLAAMAVGCAQAAFDLAKSHALEREQFGQPLAKFQVLRHRLVDMHMEITKARAILHELVDGIDAGRDVAELASIAKITSTETLQFVTNHGMQIMASAGYSTESAMQRYWRDARLYSFGEGSNEIQREIIAGHLGL